MLQILDNTGADPEARVRIKRAIDHLQALERASIFSQVSTWLQKASKESWVIWVIIAYLSWLLILWAIFIVKPLWLLHWNEALKNQLSVKIVPSKSELTIGMTLGYLLLITLIAHHRRVLDAWVRSHIKKARETFNELKTVNDREVHVSCPVKVDGQLVEISSATVRAHVGKADRQCRWLTSVREEPARQAWLARSVDGVWLRARPTASPPISCSRSLSRTSLTIPLLRPDLSDSPKQFAASCKPSSARLSQFTQNFSSTCLVLLCQLNLSS